MPAAPLAVARAEEGVVLAHVDNAVVFAGILEPHRSLSDAVEDYLEIMRVSGGRAQSVHQRAMARLAEARLGEDDPARAKAFQEALPSVRNAGLAAFLQERALKRKRPGTLTRMLPPMAESERLQVRLLAASEAVLGLGLISGMSVLYFAHGTLIRLDHKTLLSFATFIVIGLLLIAHARVGMRGRQAARIVLLAYLMMTLAYPGVKFVSSVLVP